MALQLPSIGYLRGYEGKADLVGEFSKGLSFGRGLRDDGEAGSLIEQLYGLSKNAPSTSRMGADTIMHGGVVPGGTGGVGDWLGSLIGGQPQDAGSQLVNNSHAAVNASTDNDLDSYFKAIRATESGGNDAAKNPNSSALGRYQMVNSTWNGLIQSHPELGLTPDGRLDPAQQEKGVRALTMDNMKALKQAGVPISPTALYSAHFLGAGAAPKALTAAPETPMSSIVSAETVQANPFLADMTAGEFQEWAKAKSGSGSGYIPPKADRFDQMPTPMRQVPRPSPELMRRLFENTATRPLAQALMQQDFATVDEYQTFRSDDGGLYQANVRTGEVKPLKAGTGATTYRTVTDPGERSALGIDPDDNSVYQVDGSNKLNKVGGSGVNVTVGGEGQYDKTVNENLAKTFITAQDESSNALKGLNTLSAMEQVMADPNFYSGFGSEPLLGVKRLVSALGLSPEAATSMETFNALARNAALDKMGGSLGAGFSNADRDFIVEQTANLGATPEGNKSLIDIHRKLANRQVEIGKLATQYANAHDGRLDRNWGTYLAEWAEQNPLFPVAGGGGATAPKLPDPMGMR